MGNMGLYGAAWRKLAYAGSRYGPSFWVRFSPPVIGWTCALTLRTQRAQVLENLRLLRGRRGFWSEQRDLFATFANYAACLAESLGAERRDAAATRIVVRGAEILTQFLEAGRGFVLGTAHVGPWDSAARLLSRDLHADIALVMRKELDPGAAALHDAMREKAGIKVVHVGEHPLDALPLVHHLKRPGVVAMQLDRCAPAQRKLEVELAGKPFIMPEGPLRLAAAASVPLIPIFARRLGYFSYEFQVCEPLQLTPRAGPQEIQATAQRAAHAMQDFLLQNPTQWFHFGPADPAAPHSQ